MRAPVSQLYASRYFYTFWRRRLAQIIILRDWHTPVIEQAKVLFTLKKQKNE